MVLSTAVLSSCVDCDSVEEIHFLEGAAWQKSLAPILGTPKGYSVFVTFMFSVIKHHDLSYL